MKLGIHVMFVTVRWSLPVWGAWIETIYIDPMRQVFPVAPRVGSVD